MSSYDNSILFLSISHCAEGKGVYVGGLVDLTEDPPFSDLALIQSVIAVPHEPPTKRCAC